ncbi:MAG: gamma-glutamyl-gamma-aminobutyrate hydrolase family protein [Gammaproteobacteria bacterium]
MLLSSSAGDKYLRAVAVAANCTLLLIPVSARYWPDRYGTAGRSDGILLTGVSSNAEPHHYGRTQRARHAARSNVTRLTPPIPKTLAAGVPLFAICRGFQELNVALGGTLHQKVHEQAGKNDHREDYNLEISARYSPVHEVQLTKGGLLAKLANSERVTVNSLHSQGVDQLAPGVTVEARAPDGLVEAFTVDKVPAFALAVQWHPEWRVLENPFYTAIFRAFGQACAARAGRRRGMASAATVASDNEAVTADDGC